MSKCMSESLTCLESILQNQLQNQFKFIVVTNKTRKKPKQLSAKSELLTHKSDLNMELDKDHNRTI